MSFSASIGYLSLGSNLGDRLGTLRRAVKCLQDQDLPILADSAVYQTAPLEIAEQPDFLNLALAVRLGISAEELLRCLQGIEAQLGRQPTVRFGPRTIDLDILLVGQEVIATETLSIPHPRMHLRRFVLLPLSEIASQLRHPILGLTVGELLQASPDRSNVERYCGPIA